VNKALSVHVLTVIVILAKVLHREVILNLRLEDVDRVVKDWRVHVRRVLADRKVGTLGRLGREPGGSGVIAY
jgi:hypothetical protein